MIFPKLRYFVILVGKMVHHVIAPTLAFLISSEVMVMTVAPNPSPDANSSSNPALSESNVVLVAN